MVTKNERYVFIAEWYDKPADLIRTYNLTYFLDDDTIDMAIKIFII